MSLTAGPRETIMPVAVIPERRVGIGPPALSILNGRPLSQGTRHNGANVRIPIYLVIVATIPSRITTAEFRVPETSSTQFQSSIETRG